MVHNYVSIEIFWKQRIQATKNALKEADNWTTLTNEIEDCLDNGDLALISKKLNGIQGSLKILSHVPDYEDRVILVEGTYFLSVDSCKLHASCRDLSSSV